MDQTIRESQLKDKVSRPGPHGEIVFCCIYCSDDNFHLYVNKAKGVFNCFKCGAHGRYLKNNQDRYSISLDKFDQIMRPVKTKKSEVKSLPWSRLIYTTPHEVDPDGMDALSYLLDRGLHPEEIYSNKLRYSLDRDQPYSSTIVFTIPIGSELRPKFFTCRKLDDDKRKYIAAPWPKEDAMYVPWGTWYPRDIDLVVLCEGVFDAHKIARHAPSAALLGKTPTPQQMLKIISWQKPVLVFLDPEAWRQSIALQTALKGRVPWVGGNQTLVTGTDPGSANDSEIRRIINEAVSISKRSSERD